MTTARRAVIRGRVQGVGFRMACERQAAATGAHGWVRNEPDGSVTAVVEGEREVVDRMIHWLHEGPQAAHVESVEVTEVEPSHPGGFSVR